MAGQYCCPYCCLYCCLYCLLETGIGHLQGVVTATGSTFWRGHWQGETGMGRGINKNKQEGEERVLAPHETRLGRLEKAKKEHTPSIKE